LIGALGVLNGAACNLVGHDCTDIGCAGGVFVNLSPAGGVWQDGEYSLEIALDEREETCAFRIPDDLPASGSVSSLSCGQRISAQLVQRSTCEETRDRNSISQSCTPIPNQYELSLSAYTEPTTISLELARDGIVILNDSRTLAYQQSQPNGPGCGPVCRQAQLELSLDD